MAAKVRELPGGQAEQAVESIIRATDGTLADDTAEKRIQQRTDIGPTEKLNLVRSRRGQGVFRETLEKIEKNCRVTGVLDRRHLRASHIKPWCICRRSIPLSMNSLSDDCESPPCLPLTLIRHGRWNTAHSRSFMLYDRSSMQRSIMELARLPRRARPRYNSCARARRASRPSSASRTMSRS
jgi:hypothetical protein